MKSEAAISIDLRVRIQNDGSPLWRLLSSIRTPALRNERIRNLAYVGALVDSGRISVQVQAGSVPVLPASELLTQATEFDLRLRVLNDGGILFQMLAANPAGAGRVGRLKTLASIGAMFELGSALFSGDLQQIKHAPSSAANADQFSNTRSIATSSKGASQ